MTLVKFNHAPVVKTYDNLVNELFNNFPSSWANPSKDVNSIPATNVTETANAYHLELNVPGRNKEDFKINIDKDLLTISFERKEVKTDDTVQSIRREFSFNSFKRSFSLDEKIDVTGIQAKYENGILKIELLKKEEVKEEPKQIVIS